MSNNTDKGKGNGIVSDDTVVRYDLTPKQVRTVSLITIWIVLAGLWQTMETAWVFLAWVFR